MAGLAVDVLYVWVDVLLSCLPLEEVQLCKEKLACTLHRTADVIAIIKVAPKIGITMLTKLQVRVFCTK